MHMRKAKPFLAIAIFLAIHAGVVLLPVDYRSLGSNIAITLAAAGAALACAWRYIRCRGAAKTRWGLLSLGITFWFIGQLTFTYLDSFLHMRQDTALFSDFYFFIYGIPILLALASANQEEHSTLLLIIDSFQALLAILLSSQLLFFRTLTINHPEPLSTLTLTYVYDIENVALLVAAALRVLADPSGEEAEFSRKTCIFLFVYAVISGGLNYVNAPTGTLSDLLWSFPFLLLMVIVLPPFGKPSPKERRRVRSAQRSVPALIIWNSSPTLFTMAVLVQSAFLVREHLYIGITALILALLTYTMRTAVFQTQLMQTQEAHSASEELLRRANDKLHKISVADPLTGIANRRRFEEIALVEWNRALRFGWPLTLLMVDVDFFKALNDSFGHARGDECLIQVAGCLGANLRRGGEMLARYGGEEFVALLPNTRLSEGIQIAEMMRTSVTDLGISSANTAVCEYLSVSIGVASAIPSPEESLTDLLAAADAALYQAKALGRNRTEHASSETGAICLQ
jgi:diguanylate cyclase (GGDEF)-like protein